MFTFKAGVLSHRVSADEISKHILKEATILQIVIYGNQFWVG